MLIDEITMSSLENTILVISVTITATLLLIGGLITFIYAIKRNNRLIFLFSAMWLLSSVSWYIDAAAHYLYSIFLMTLVIIPQLIGYACIIIFIELSRKEHVSPLKIIILSVISFLLLFVNFLPGGFEIIPGYGVHNVGLLRIFQMIWLLYIVILYFTWSYQTWRKAPNKLRTLVTWLLFGSILFSIVSALLYAVGSFLRIFNSIALFINGIGAFITIVVILKDPKIIYILPFKAYRILVVNTNEASSLFKYDWAGLGEVEENIFTMVLQAVGSVLDEILKKGEVREIHLDRAVLLIQHNKIYPIASVLVTSRSTKSLRYGLKKFNEQFISKFYSDQEDLYEVSRFEQANKLVEVIFDFVPKYE